MIGCSTSSGHWETSVARLLFCYPVLIHPDQQTGVKHHIFYTKRPVSTGLVVQQRPLLPPPHPPTHHLLSSGLWETRALQCSAAALATACPLQH